MVFPRSPVEQTVWGMGADLNITLWDTGSSLSAISFQVGSKGTQIKGKKAVFQGFSQDNSASL